ncbi:hypothetical protein EV368DRAFT_82608 [Lentinula lateritia]|uniref:Uncharacterized protein n=1 Tax=Lentinula aff. lateritia TaxID=2804960 RepID=A0ACC1TNS2_9AGAR|nr:hypothetical protein F5876DRAFT_80714 [Lentinula aff. lateritia]KAJ3852368.1 hypothetical protein EV368DRAFT_82608 [Lentinula lateritia]
MARGKVTQFKLKLKKIYTRITRNRLTAVFFLFAFFHCFAQGIIQSLLFVLDSQYYGLLSDITQAADIPPANHTDLSRVSGGFRLEMCNFIPHNSSNCFPIFDSRDKIIVENSPDADAQLRGETIIAQLNSQSFKIIADAQGQSHTVSQVVFEADGGVGSVNMSESCTSMLLYPTQHFQNNRREEIAFMFLQFWLFILSIIAMIHDSVPHVLTVFITRILLTAWSIYALWRTEWQQAVFQQAIEAPGTSCSAAMFGVYFSTRIPYEIPDIILNCSALGISAFLSWTLLRTYNAEVFTCVGAPKAITKLYKYFLALQVSLQLEAFVLITAAALWVDQLFNTYIRNISAHTTVYEVLVILYAVVLGPWLLTAWFGIRSEKRLVTLAFIFVGILFILGSSVMFISQVYRWRVPFTVAFYTCSFVVKTYRTFYAWPCLGCFITASLALLVASVVLGILCYTNFGKGLAQYLYVEASLSSSNFTPEVFERDVESTYIDNFDDEKLKAKGLQADFTTHYLPALGSIPSRDSASSG